MQEAGLRSTLEPRGGKTRRPGITRVSCGRNQGCPPQTPKGQRGVAWGSGRRRQDPGCPGGHKGGGDLDGRGFGGGGAVWSVFLCSRSSSNSLKNLPCPREVARSGFAMLLLLGLCLGLPLFSKSQEEARSWDDTSEQVSRRKSCGSATLFFPSISLGRMASGQAGIDPWDARNGGGGSPYSGPAPFLLPGFSMGAFPSVGHLCHF